MTEDERDQIIDLLPPAREMAIWSDDEELTWPGIADRRFDWWAEALDHGYPPGVSRGCVKCGPFVTCSFGAFYDSLVASVVRELDRVGALQHPPAPPASEA